MNVKEFLKQNKTELWNKLIEHNLLNTDDIEDGDLTIDDLDCDRSGCYEAGDSLVKTDDICGVMEGMDLSFHKKYVTVEDIYEAKEFKLEVNGKTIYGLMYNV